MTEKENLIYERKLRIRSEQVTAGRIMRTSELFKLMEEASIAHTEELGCTREKTLDRGLLWVIARQTAKRCLKDEKELHTMPEYDEEITIRSWPGEMMMGIFFPRFYEIWRDGQLIIKGYAMWALIDENTREIVFPEEHGIVIPGLPGTKGILLPALIKPADSADFADTADKTCASDRASTAADGAAISDTVRFSQTDINGHMNNTRYFDIIDDALWSICDRNRQNRNFSEKAGTAESSITEITPSSGVKAGGDKQISSESGIPHWTRISANYISELRAGDSYDLNISMHKNPETPEMPQGTIYYFEGIRKTQNGESGSQSATEGAVEAGRRTTSFRETGIAGRKISESEGSGEERGNNSEASGQSKSRVSFRIKMEI